MGVDFMINMLIKSSLDHLVSKLQSSVKHESRVVVLFILFIELSPQLCIFLLDFHGSVTPYTFYANQSNEVFL